MTCNLMSRGAVALWKAFKSILKSKFLMETGCVKLKGMENKLHIREYSLNTFPLSFNCNLRGLSMTLNLIIWSSSINFIELIKMSIWENLSLAKETGTINFFPSYCIEVLHRLGITFLI